MNKSKHLGPTDSSVVDVDKLSTLLNAVPKARNKRPLRRQPRPIQQIARRVRSPYAAKKRERGERKRPLKPAPRHRAALVKRAKKARNVAGRGGGAI